MRPRTRAAHASLPSKSGASAPAHRSTPRLAGLLGSAIIVTCLAAPSAAVADIFDDYYATHTIFDEPESDVPSFELQADLGIFTNRMFRGQKLSDGASFEPRLRAQANLPYFSVYGEAFGHVGGDGSDGSPDNETEFEGSHTAHFAELGYDIGVMKNIEFVTIEAGHRWYSYDKKTARLDNTGEFFGRIQLDTIAHPHLEMDFDWDAYKGSYGEVGVEQPVPIDIPHRRLEVVPFATLSFSSGLADSPRPIYADDGFVALDTGIRLELLISENFYVQPIVQYTEGFDSNADSLFTAGIRLGAKLDIN